MLHCGIHSGSKLVQVILTSLLKQNKFFATTTAIFNFRHSRDGLTREECLLERGA